MISGFKYITQLFQELDKEVKKIKLFVIGGAVLLYYGIKPATKDIDLVVESREEFVEFERALKKMCFTIRLPSAQYHHMDINRIFERQDFRIDLFHKTVCKGFSLSKDMIERAEEIISLNNIKLFLCSNEDVFLFKTMTEREGDLEDCISLAKRGLSWETVFKELNHQIEHSGKDIWITWIGERLDLLEDKGLTIPIMGEVNKLREKYFKEYGERMEK